MATGTDANQAVMEFDTWAPNNIEWGSLRGEQIQKAHTEAALLTYK